MAGVFVPFIPVQIVTQPGAGRTNPGEKQERKPEIIAVLVEEGALGAVDVGRRSPVYGQLGVSFSRLYLAGGVTTMRTAGNVNGIMDINVARRIAAGEIHLT